MIFNSKRTEQRKELRHDKDPETLPHFACMGCGELSHPNGPKGWKNCPVSRLKCFYYGIKGHLEKVCHKPKQVPNSKSTDTFTRNQSTILTNGETTHEQKRGGDVKCHTSLGIKIGSVGAPQNHHHP